MSPNKFSNNYKLMRTGFMMKEEPLERALSKKKLML
jgi:hypothetical protein